MPSIYSTTVGGTTVGANSLKLVGDGASGVGPYTRFGTPQLQAIKVISSQNYSTSYSSANSEFAQAVAVLQTFGEVYYVGIPGNAAAGFVALVNFNTLNSGDENTSDESFDDLEDALDAASGQSDTAVTKIALTGVTWA